MNTGGQAPEVEARGITWNAQQGERHVHVAPPFNLELCCQFRVSTYNEISSTSNTVVLGLPSASMRIPSNFQAQHSNRV